jgi:transglutaminase-like putative cysteine protease
LAEYGLKHSLETAVRRAGRAEKFITLLLLFILLTAATAGVSVVLTGPDWASLWQSLLFGLLLGWLLAILRWPAWRSAVVVILIGLLFSLLYAGGLNEKILAVFKEIFRLIGSVLSSRTIRGLDIAPIGTAMQQVFISTRVVLGRVAEWLNDLRLGQPSFDPVAAGFVWGFVVWLVAAWAGWVVEAIGNAILAVLPALLLNLITLSYGRYNSASIYLLLGMTLVLIAVVQYDRREQDWNETRVAYPARKSREIGSISLIIAIILVVLSASISSLSLQRILTWGSEIRGPSAQGESGLAKSLGIIPAPTPTPDSFSTLRSPGLPRELLIGSGPELSTQLVMSVKINDLSLLSPVGQLPPFYWRSFTYDVYTGHGWSSSATIQTPYQPDQAIQPDHLPWHVLIQERVSAVPGTGGSIYAAGEPVTIDVSSSAAWRSANDLFGIQSTSDAYETQSLVPVIDENTLRGAGQDYSSWVTQRYLALPPEVPTRVKQLAIQLTATEPTPYDRAHAIEQYLRTFPYTLDVPRPPANQDLVDYFLFDLRKGYCDYYASAMVVLARAAGIPARLATGYASGIYNLNSKRFIVTQADAHSWVEVYFPGAGWVSFEPTAGLPAINRSGQATQATTPAPTLLVVPPKNTGFGSWNIGKYMGYLLLVVVAAPVFLWVIIDETLLRRLKPQLAAREVYRRLRRYGRVLNVPTDGGETPYEFSAALVRRILEIIVPGWMTSAGVNTIAESRSIISQIVEVSYRPSSAEAVVSLGIISQWNSLRWRLRLMWIMKILKSIQQKFRGRFQIQTEEQSPLVG